MIYFQFLINREIIESILENLNYICVTKLAHEEEFFLDGWKTFSSFSVHRPDSGHWRISGLTVW